MLDGANGSTIERAAVECARRTRGQAGAGLLRLHENLDPAFVQERRRGEVEAEREPESPAAQHRLTAIRRQRASLEEILERRATLQRQLDGAALALSTPRNASRAA